MTEYKELINSLRQEAEWEAYLQPHSQYETPKLLSKAADVIEKLSTPSDVQPVVRCIKCKYYEGLACCELIGDCGGTNWFCGWGEPKEET